jgi:hypothetical protein
VTGGFSIPDRSGLRAAGGRLDVQRLRVVPADPVADAAQPREVAQVLRRDGSAGHLRDRATSRRRCLAPLASHPTGPKSQTTVEPNHLTNRPVMVLDGAVVVMRIIVDFTVLVRVGLVALLVGRRHGRRLV